MTRAEADGAIGLSVSLLNFGPGVEILKSTTGGGPFAFRPDEARARLDFCAA
jgi:hypothetical protein